VSIEPARLALGVGGELGVCLGSFATAFCPIAGSRRGAELNVFFAFVSDPGFEFEAVSGSTLAFIALVPFVMHRTKISRLQAVPAFTLPMDSIKLAVCARLRID
jgi:hypothetical protein